MNRRDALATLGAGALTVATAGICLPEQTNVAGLPPSPLSIQEALRLAEAYLKKHPVPVKHSHIVSAILRQETASEQSCWVITWDVNETGASRSNESVVKGGWFALHVQADKSILPIYGK